MYTRRQTNVIFVSEYCQGSHIKITQVSLSQSPAAGAAAAADVSALHQFTERLQVFFSFSPPPTIAPEIQTHALLC